MTKEEEKNIVKQAEILLRKRDVDGARSIMKSIYDMVKENKIVDNHTALVMARILTEKKEDLEWAAAIINQVSLTHDMKTYVEAMDIAASLERQNYKKAAAYDLILGMKKEWESREKETPFSPYYESKIALLLSNYTTNDKEAEELLRSIIRKGADRKYGYGVPNDVYVLANKKLARTYLYNGRYEDAIEVCDEFLGQFSDNDYNILFYKAQAYMELGNLEEAKLILNEIDITRIKDKRFIQDFEKVKSIVENNSVTMSEIQQDYFNRTVTYEYVDGVLLPKGEGGHKGGKRKGDVLPKTERDQEDEKARIIREAGEFIKDIIPSNVDVNVEMGSEHFKGYMLFSFSGDNVGDLGNYVILNKFKDGNALYIIHKDLELNYVDITKGELTARRDEIGSDGKILKMNHSKHHKSKAKKLIRDVRENGEKPIKEYNEKQRKGRERQRKDKQIKGNSELLKQINELRDKINKARELKKELIEQMNAAKTKEEKDSWKELVQAQSKEISELQQKIRDIRDMDEI